MTDFYVKHRTFQESSRSPGGYERPFSWKYDGPFDSFELAKAHWDDIRPNWQEGEVVTKCDRCEQYAPAVTPAVAPAVAPAIMLTGDTRIDANGFRVTIVGSLGFSKEDDRPWKWGIMHSSDRALGRNSFGEQVWGGENLTLFDTKEEAIALVEERRKQWPNVEGWRTARVLRCKPAVPKVYEEWDWNS